ncbi:LutC/YkgG family protein [Terriglobus sp.]|uniref:LutC/YkgG family protein n=1 Tax=Terriglobus sp. TaxID=1889013 RepID=UPI003B000FA7
MPEAMAGSAREAVLGRIRVIVGEARAENVVAQEWAGLPRAYSVASGADEDAKLQRLVDRLHDYDAVVYRIAPEEIASTVLHILSTLGLSEVLVPAGLDRSWLPGSVVAGSPTVAAESAAKVGHDDVADGPIESGAIQCVEDRGFAPHELDRFAAVLTASTLAIAETGTLLLQNLLGQGRRAATLVPDVHLCVVREADVVATVPEAMRRLQATAELPTTFISGPSATADIEMTRIKGVHGPRFLHVLLVR